MQRMKNWKTICFAGCLFWAAVLCTGCAKEQKITVYESQTAEVLASETAKVSEGAEAHEQDSEKKPPETPQAEEGQKQGGQPATIYVQVCGQVNSPGVYEMHAGDRVFQAVELAGGMTVDANSQAVNQACEVSDGQMIYIYSNEEWHEICEGNITGNVSGVPNVTANTQSQTDDGLININQADEGLLTDLSGIGKTLARRIVEFRDENGEFQSIEDIKKVSGIGDSLFEKIKDHIKV